MALGGARLAATCAVWTGLDLEVFEESGMKAGRFLDEFPREYLTVIQDVCVSESMGVSLWICGRDGRQLKFCFHSCSSYGFSSMTS